MNDIYKINPLQRFKHQLKLLLECSNSSTNEDVKLVVIYVLNHEKHK